MDKCISNPSLIEINGNCGLGEYSETGLENNNKYLRVFRQHLARKNSQESNLTDCLNRFWLKSDPCIRNAGPKKYCSRCTKMNDHHTISCPLKQASDTMMQTCLSFFDFYISELYLHSE